MATTAWIAAMRKKQKYAIGSATAANAGGRARASCASSRCAGSVSGT